MIGRKMIETKKMRDIGGNKEQWRIEESKNVREGRGGRKKKREGERNGGEGRGNK